MGDVGHRSYAQYCPVAVALDDVGDRWTLLILRELLIGDRRFTDLRAALPGIAPNLLAERLRQLQDRGLVEHRVLPPPAARTVYAATAEGRAAGPVLQALARYGVARMDAAPDDAEIRPQMVVYGLLAPFHRPEPAGHRFHARLEVDGETFDLMTDGPRVSVVPSPHGEPDVVVRVSGRDVVAARRHERPLPVDGDAAARFVQLFRLD